MVLCTSGYCILSCRLSAKVIELAVLIVQALYTLCCRLIANLRELAALVVLAL